MYYPLCAVYLLVYVTSAELVQHKTEMLSSQFYTYKMICMGIPYIEAAVAFPNLFTRTSPREKDSSKYIFNSRGHGHIKPNGNLKTFNNNTYYETPDNMMRVPISQFNDDMQMKKRANKKVPKRTIQKIIKKHRKSKKLYFNQATSLPTMPAANMDMKDEVYIPDEDQREISMATTQVNTRKKIRNRNSKLARYPMPFQRMSRHEGYKRMRRETDRDNTMILEDFNEIEFVDSKKDYDVVKMHGKKYW